MKKTKKLIEKVRKGYEKAVDDGKNVSVRIQNEMMHRSNHVERIPDYYEIITNIISLFI